MSHPVPRVLSLFYCYAENDRLLRDELDKHLSLLRGLGWIESWYDQQIHAGMEREHEYITHLEKADIILLLISPDFLASETCLHTMRLAMERAHERRAIVVPVILRPVDWQGAEFSTLQVLPSNSRPVVSWPRSDEAFEHIAHGIRRVIEALRATSSASISALPFEPRNPYKGLRAFTSNDAGDFFGRDQLVQGLIQTLEKFTAPDQQGRQKVRLQAIIGPSGSGKSSLIMAGLLPRLQQRELPGSQEWIYLEAMKPGKHPVEALALTLAAHFSEKTIQALCEDLNEKTARGLYRLAMHMSKSPETKVVLFVDQFEELFTQTESEDERQHFISLLLTASRERRGSLIILLTLRADFYDRPMQYRELAELIQQQQYLVLPMNLEELRAVIEQPAALPDVLLKFEKGLVDELLFEVRGQAGALPLLQFTLDQLFQKRQGDQLTLHAYQDLGGIKGALERYAEDIYTKLPSEDHRKLTQILFMRLIDPGTTELDTTRRRAALSEFSLIDDKQARLLQETMDAFITARLLMTNEAAGIATVEVSHEALIREWTRCARWVRETRENLPFQQTLSKDVAQWEELGKPNDRLYRDSQLRTMKKRIDRSLLNKQEVLFLHASMIHQRVQWIKMIALLLVPVIVLGLVLTPLLVFRPSWCPSWLCSSPQVLIAKGGTHDSNLQVTFQTLQSSIKVIPDDPSTYTLGNLPVANDAQLINTSQSLPYRVVLKIHSLQQGRYGLVIDQVTLVVNKQAQMVPYPLRVWIANNVLAYDNNLYHVTYRGQEVHTVLFALPTQPVNVVELLPGETDELSLEVRSAVVADLSFQVQVTYHVIGDLASYTLTLPNVFEVIFSDPANWHPYSLQDGHLVPAS